MKRLLNAGRRRLGLITSIDGKQLVTLILDPDGKAAHMIETPVDGTRYPSLTPQIPQCHWQERIMWDMFGLHPDGHPRLKHILLHEQYGEQFYPLAQNTEYDASRDDKRIYKFLEVKGEGVYEIPVGPIHAGIIEPGHFRFSCLGEVILNLEIRLGYLHRGVEKRLTEVAPNRCRFVCEAAASDSAAACALAHALAIESLTGVKAPPRADFLRTLCLEIERVSMHLSDMGGLAGDIGFLGISSSFSRLRGSALRMGELLTGTRFQRAYIAPGGVVRDANPATLSAIKKLAKQLETESRPVIQMFIDSQAAKDRMENIGRVSPSLAKEFGLVGVAGRASGLAYDARMYFPHGFYPNNMPSAVEQTGDVMARLRVRVSELENSLNLINECISLIPAGDYKVDAPEELPVNAA
ncbi:MAG TPA: NADH-quinone oxidoreductase subunit C, partial [Candidatus Obscuribacterales bacterium]